MNLKSFMIYVAIFIAGIVVAPKTKTVEVASKCEQTQCNADEVKAQMVELRDIDNEAVGLAVDTIEACQAIVTATATVDIQEIDKQTQIINETTGKITTVTAKRNALLEKAGISN